MTGIMEVRAGIEQAKDGNFAETGPDWLSASLNRIYGSD